MATLLEGLLEYQQKQANLIETQQQTQENNLLLQSKMAGLAQEQQLRKAWTAYDPENPKSLDNVAQLVGQVNPKMALDVLKESTSIKNNQTNQFKNQIEGATKANQLIGSLAGGVIASGGEGYETVMPQLLSYGVQGLTGNYKQDLPRLQQLAQGSISMDKRLASADRQVTQQQQQTRIDLMAQHYGDLVTQNQRSFKLQQDRLAFEQSRAKDIADAQTRSQAGKAEDRNLRLQKLAIPDTHQKLAAEDLIKNDPRAEGLSDAQIRAATQIVAGRASKRLAANFAKNKNADDTAWTPDDYDELLAQSLDEAFKNKEIVPPPSRGFFGFGKGEAKVTPPTGKQVAPAKTPGIPRIKSDADYMALPSGTIFIDPNGTQRRKP